MLTVLQAMVEHKTKEKLELFSRLNEARQTTEVEIVVQTRKMIGLDRVVDKIRLLLNTDIKSSIVRRPALVKVKR